MPLVKLLIMASEKLKEVREWLTFALSAATVIAIPVGFIILENQRLQIEKNASERYVDKMTFSDAKSRWDTGLGELRGSMQALQLEQQHQTDVMQMMKEKFDSLQRKASP